LDTQQSSLNGKVALITGGARRLGRAIALKLAQAGANIAVHYRTSVREALETQQQLVELGVDAVTVQGDLSQTIEAERIVDQAAAAWGRLDILVNNASAFAHTPLGSVTEEQWDLLLNTNLRGPFFCAQHAGSLMRQQGNGVIINLIDTGIYLAWPGYVPYLISKAGLEQMTYGLARALAPQVRVNGIAPGPALLEDDHTPEERERFIKNTLLRTIGGAHTIAGAALYLAEADFVTGVVIPVDGGQRWRR
jgi:NAD(P)-dependent dehydrogenase (short-subunit alcohol dehydrogenase family)